MGVPRVGGHAAGVRIDRNGDGIADADWGSGRDVHRSRRLSALRLLQNDRRHDERGENENESEASEQPIHALKQLVDSKRQGRKRSVKDIRSLAIVGKRLGLVLIEGNGGNAGRFGPHV